MARNKCTYSKENPSPDGPWRFQKGSNHPRWVCPVCEHDTVLGRKNRHNCGGPKFDHPEYEEIRLYRQRLCNRAKGKGVDCTLSTLDIANLLEEAGISVSQLGRNKGCYHLARHGDTGNYEIGNCRFLPMSENIKEQKPNGSKECICDGVVYPSRAAAARAIGVSDSTIGDRIRSTLSRWADYKWKEV